MKGYMQTGRSVAATRAASRNAVLKTGMRMSRIIVTKPCARLPLGVARMGGQAVSVSNSRNSKFVTQAATIEAPAADTPATTIFERKFEDSDTDVKVVLENDIYSVSIVCGESKDRVLHWGIDDWTKPDESFWPADTNPFDEKAVQSTFQGGTTVNMTIPKENCPESTQLILKEIDSSPDITNTCTMLAGKELDPEQWHNGGGSGYTIILKEQTADSIASKAIKAESTYEHWSLFGRLRMVNECLDAALLAGASGMALIFTWLGLSSTREQLWYKSSKFTHFVA
eukprot:gene20029-26745_t